MQKLLCSFLLFGALFSSAYALDLRGAYQAAKENDPQYKSAEFLYQAAQEKLPQARALLLPTLTASGSTTRTQKQNEARVTNKIYKLELKQPLFNLASISLYQEAELTVANDQISFAQSQQDLILRVATAYFDVLSAIDALSFQESQKKAIAEQLAAAKRNFEVGAATITDTHEAQSRFDLAKAQELFALNDLAIKRHALEQLIGKNAPAVAKLKNKIALPTPEPKELTSWVNLAEQQNYGVQSATLALKIAQKEILKSQASLAPTVDLFINRGRITQNQADLSNNVGISWNMPLFSGFSSHSQIQSAYLLKEKTQADLNNAKRKAKEQAHQFYLGVYNTIAQINALEAAETSSQSSLEANQLGYQVGVRINIDVLNAQQQLFSTRRDLARARYDAILQSLKLKSATATLREEDIDQINQLLQN
jgi:outer membrane protein